MNSQEIPHLQDEDLVRLLDGELGEREAAFQRSHIDACWTCRTRMEEFESSIGEYVRYREGALKPMLPPPPHAWTDLRRRFEEADRRLDAERSAPVVRSASRFGFRTAYWIAAAASVILGMVLISRFEYAPSVRASELLRKASAVQPSIGPSRRIRVKSSRRTLTRPALLVTAATPEAVELKQMFDAAHFSWEEPLSAKSYSVWHDQLLEKRDEVKAIDQDASAGVPVYVIKTSTVTSTLRKATLTLRARDLRPLREMLEFSSETVEITEIPEASGGEFADASGKTVAGPSASPRSLVPPAATPPIRAELEVFAALHRIGADLGEPIAMRQSGPQLLVVGTGLTANQKEQLTAALAGIAEVQVRFEDATANPNPANIVADRAAPATAPMQARLQALLGSRDSAEDFTNRTLDASDAVMARTHALRALVHAFPPDVERGLTAADHAVLAALRNDHMSALSQRIAELRRVLQLAIPLPAMPPVAEESPNWQGAIEALFIAAQQFDDSLNAALAGAGGRNDDGALEKLGPALARLQMQFAACENAIR